jgi:hypothetical protein
VSRDYIPEIFKFLDKIFYSNSCGWILNSNNSSYRYWNCVNTTIQGALKYAADFAIRITLVVLHVVVSLNVELREFSVISNGSD